MTTHFLFPLTKIRLLDHVDSLISHMEVFNQSKGSLEITQAILAGNVINSKYPENKLYLRFKDRKTQELFPPILSLNQENTHNKLYEDFFELNNFFTSNYLKIESIIQLDSSKHEKGMSKIVFDSQVKRLTSLNNSLNIMKDYYLERKLESQLENIKKRYKPS